MRGEGEEGAICEGRSMFREGRKEGVMYKGRSMFREGRRE